MKKDGKLSRIVAACAAAALASSMMAGAAFAVEYPGTDGETSIEPGADAAKGTGNTGIYLKMTDTSVISVTVPTSIYLAAEAGDGAVDFAVPTNAQIVNNGKAVKVTGWKVDAANGKTKAEFDEGVTTEDESKKLAADTFYLQASIDRGFSWKDIADDGEVAAADTAWAMAKYGSTGVTSLDLQLRGQIYEATTTKYTNAPLIDTVTWTIESNNA